MDLGINCQPDLLGKWWTTVWVEVPSAHEWVAATLLLSNCTLTNNLMTLTSSNGELSHAERWKAATQVILSFPGACYLEQRPI